jgi:glycosyltransferase involved in cell wall biosynthesis
MGFNEAEDKSLRVAIVHYWFVRNGGGERVVEALAEMFPQADLFCLFAEPETMTPRLRSHRLTTSFLQRIPGGRRWYKQLLPLHPLAIEQLDVSKYDLILSSESGSAKGVLPAPDACHICYCHTPMRYLWDLYPLYRRAMQPLAGTAFALTAHYLRMWDLASANRVDHFVANSHNVAARIRRHYRRDATVVYPPVDVSSGYLSERTDEYYLVVSRLIDYKRVDLAIEACNRLNRPLRVVGDGDQYKYLRKLAGPSIKFLGRLDDEAVRENYARCRALLFPGEEDFGIVPVEAQSFGRPVLAYGRGGVLETVQGLMTGDALNVEGATGVFFAEQTVDSLVEAIEFFESVESRFSPSFIRHSVERFDTSRFKSAMTDFIDRSLELRRMSHSPVQIDSKSDEVVVSKVPRMRKAENGDRDEQVIRSR